MANSSRFRALAIMAIADERRRQVDVEGWTPEHDDAHDGGSLARAADCYLDAALGRVPAGEVPTGWPWAAHWWKPRGRERDLVRAGALYDAELDRLHRQKAIILFGPSASQLVPAVRRGTVAVIGELARTLAAKPANQR